jgi:hypothetical protein
LNTYLQLGRLLRFRCCTFQRTLLIFVQLIDADTENVFSLAQLLILLTRRTNRSAGRVDDEVGVLVRFFIKVDFGDGLVDGGDRSRNERLAFLLFGNQVLCDGSDNG